MGHSPPNTTRYDPPHRVVSLLGGLQVLSDHHELRIPKGKATSLFTFLLLNPHRSHLREQLVDQFWEEAPPDRGQRRLSNTLYQLQKAIGDGWVVRDGATLSLLVTPDLTVDVWQFETWAKSEEPHLWEQAVHLYRGDLLPEIYEDWVLARRVWLRDNYITLLLKLARHAEQTGEVPYALGWYRRLASAEPLYEEGQRGVIRTLMALDRPTEALDTYEQVEKLLLDALGVPPSPPTQTLGEQVRHEAQSRHHSTALPSNPFINPPFVGRTDEQAQLLATLQQATLGQGGLCVVLGEAGVGKSRLLQSFASAAKWRGWQVAWGYGQEFTLSSPYAPLQEALVDLLPPARQQQLRHIVQPLWLNIIARLFPMVLSLTTSSPPSEPEAYTPEQVALAVQRVMEGLHQIAPPLILLEDIQWADEGFWTLMTHLQPALVRSNCLIVLSARSETLREQPEKREVIEAWSRQGVPTLTLEGLKPTDLTVLIRAVSPRQIPAANKQIADQLNIASNGNPLLALALLQADTPHQDQSLQTLLGHRLSHLRRAARTLLQAASVLGYRFRYEELEKVVAIRDRLPVVLPPMMGELEQQGMILLEGEGYRFQHDVLRGVVYESIEEAIRHQWHRDVLEVLEQERSVEPSRLLHHAQLSQNHNAIGRHALAAGQAALSSFAMANAIQFFDQALNVLPEAAWQARYQAMMGRVHAYNVVGNRSAQQQDIHTLKTIVRHRAVPSLMVEICEREAHYHWSVGAYRKAAETIQQGLEVLARHPDPARQAALHILDGRVAREWGQYAEAQTAIEKARTLYQHLKDKEGEATTTDLLGGVAWQSGNHSRAAELHQKAATMFRASGNLIREAHSLNNLGTALWSLERYLEARETHERALELCREIGHRRGEADNLDNLGGVAWVLGEYEEAISFYSRALELRRTLSDQWGISISLGNLGSAYRLWGKTEEALTFYQEALTFNQTLGRRRGEGYVWHGIGLARLEVGDFHAAVDALLTASAIRRELGEQQNFLESQAALLLVYVTMGQISNATTLLKTNLDALQYNLKAGLRQWVHYGAYFYYHQKGDLKESQHHLLHAHRAMLEVAGALPVSKRDGFLASVPINRWIQTAIEQSSRQITARLVAADVPLGRKLTSHDYVNVRWTIYAPLDDEISSKVERRHHILQRLITEATLQEATASDEDLATALNVSTRTIERDLAALHDVGIHLTTRRRK